MDTDEITFEELLAAEPAEEAPPRSLAQLLADGFPRNGGLAELTAIVQMDDPGSNFAAVRYGYQQLLEWQGAERARTAQSAPTARIARAIAHTPRSEKL